MLVLAGAGTGKTRVIASRIVSLLERDPSLSPSNILALTFSRKAAQEMRERVEQLQGGRADDLSVFTFHGFCRQFLQERAVECGLPPRFRLLDSVEAWVFFRSLLPEWKLGTHWNLSDPSGCIEGFLRFISRAKDEQISPERVRSFARSLQETDARKRAEEVARVYQQFQEAMVRTGQMDFGDLIVQTIRILQEHPSVLRQVRERYRTILVDEFQDTNVAQIELLKWLAGPEPNLCAVGDDDQAIYRFRGASFASFLLFKEAYPAARIFRLTRNYRSTPQILEPAGRLIRHNEPDRYDPGKTLRSEQPAGPPPEILVCADDAQEAEAVAQKILHLWEAQPKGGRSFARMAVLYRAHAVREPLKEVLQRRGIPFLVRGGWELFNRPEILDLMAMLRVLADPKDSVSFVRLLAHSSLGIPVADLLQMTRRAREREQPVTVWLERESILPGWQTGGVEGSAAVRAGLDLLRKEIQKGRELLNEPMTVLIRRLVESEFLRMFFCRLPAPGEEALKALGQFLRWADRFDRFHLGEPSLSAFLSYLDAVREAGGAQAEEEEAEPIGDRVQLMTIHQAKGLEFDWVLLMGMVQGKCPVRNRREPIPFPVELMKETLPRGDYHLQEERRLFYVACTRAKCGLFITTQDRKRVRPSVFLKELSEQEGVVHRTAESSLPSGPILVSSADSLGRILLPGAGGWPVADRLSFSQLETYRICPAKYLYAYVYRIPIRATPQMNFGTDLHETLEWLYRQVMEGKRPALAPVQEFFQRLQVNGRYGPSHEEAVYRRLGTQILEEFHRKHEKRWIVPLFIEKPFSLNLGEVSIVGVIDRVDPLPDGGVRVLDYKSGKPREEAQPEQQLQLWLYAWALRELFGLDPRRVSFYYLRTNTELSFDRTEGVLEQTRSRVLKMSQQIRSGRFPTQPSPRVCSRCDFRNLCPDSAA